MKAINELVLHNRLVQPIKRILSTQKAVTTEANNALGERVELRICSDPTDTTVEIRRALRYYSLPFKRYAIKNSSPPPD